MSSVIPMNLDHGVIRSYKRLNYKAWYALAEFIDNSTQNFFDFRDVLDPENKGGCEILVWFDRDMIKIHDTAMGMNLKELAHAVSIGVPPPNTDGRSEFGLGLKTAACWFGDYWKIITKRYGETNQYEVEIDVERVASGDFNLPMKTIEKDKDLHYTTIEIQHLHRRVHPATKRRIEEYIKSIYRVDLRNIDLLITINDGAPLEPDDDGPFLVAKDQEYQRDFKFKLTNGKEISGWLGVLNPGGRRKAGMAIVRRGRVVIGQPSAWRPENIFGYDAPNDMRNQRLVGELHLDNFQISHTKDSILFEGDEELEIINYLKDEFAAYIEIANISKKELGVGVEKPDPAEVKMGMDELRRIVESPEFVDAVNLQEVPPDEIVVSSNTPLITTAAEDSPQASYQIGNITCNLFLNENASLNDPYFASDYPEKNKIIVIVNTNHPHFYRIQGGAIGVQNYLMECVYDALAEWKAMSAKVIKHDTIKYLKDGYLKYELKL